MKSITGETEKISLTHLWYQPSFIRIVHTYRSYVSLTRIAHTYRSHVSLTRIAHMHAQKYCNNRTNLLNVLNHSLNKLNKKKQTDTSINQNNLVKEPLESIPSFSIYTSNKTRPLWSIQHYYHDKPRRKTNDTKNNTRPLDEKPHETTRWKTEPNKTTSTRKKRYQKDNDPTDAHVTLPSSLNVILPKVGSGKSRTKNELGDKHLYRPQPIKRTDIIKKGERRETEHNTQKKWKNLN